MREDDTLARLAGDEFVAVCVDLPTTDPEVLDDLLTTVTDRLRGALGAAVRVDGVDLVVSASIGVTVVPGSVEATVGELLRAADGAMYAAKDAGRDRVHRTSPPRHRDTVQRSVGAAAGTGLARDLMHALDRGEFRVHYQPVVDSGTRRVRAVEALVRWQHPHLGLLPASDFIDLADHSGRLPALGHWVLRQACLDLADWREAVGGLAPERVFCNLSAAELLDPRLHEVISDALSAARLLPRDLGLEIVEDDLSGSDLTHALELLHTAGHPLSIDDFGTGYSSLSRLVSLPVSIAKIDRSFVAGLPQDHRSRALVDAVVVVAHSLGLEVIAEGVETIDQAAELTKAGCEYQQGYHESPPLSAEDLLRVLREPAR